MPADLDEMFAALGEQADSLPIGSADSARRRGRQRARTRTTLAAAVAVGAVAGGAVLALRPAPAPTPPAAPSGILQLGSAQPYGTKTRRVMAAVDGQSLYTAWLGQDGEIGVTGTDLHTGIFRWQNSTLGAADDFLGIVALPRAVLVSVAAPGRRLEVLDPATGAKRWELPYAAADDLVYYDDLVVLQTVAGDTRAYDWTTGAVRWTRRATPDPAQRTLGMAVPADERRAGPAGPPPAFSDRHLIQVTRSGQVQIRDAGTGDLQDTRESGPPQRHMVASGGRLFSAENTDGQGRYRIRVTTVTGDPDSRLVRTGATGTRFQAMAPCGDGRLCVTETGPGDPSSGLTAIDVAGTGPDWRVPTVADPALIQAVGDVVLVAGSGEQALYTGPGRKLIQTSGRLGWDGNRSVLELPARAGANVIRIPAGGSALLAVGRMPVASTACVWTTDRLACPGTSSLTIWTLPH